MTRTLPPSAAAGAALPAGAAASGRSIFSPGSPMKATGASTGTGSPALAAIFKRVPEAGASISFVSLSVDTENSTSPSLTASPSFFFHSSMVPSVIVRPSFGITTTLPIALYPPQASISAGFSSRVLTRCKNSAATEPSTTRWSAVRLRFIIGRMTISPLRTTTLSSMVVTPRMATSG